MSFLDQFPRNPSSECLMDELRHFFQASANAGAGDEQEFKRSIRTGLWLLRHLPVSRDSVLEIISIVYQEFVKKHLASVKDNDGVISMLEEEFDEFLQDIHSTLLIYLDSCGEIWSPILSNWALHLLGQLSTAHANRAPFSRNQSVNEIITIWMGSKAIQSLLAITSKCLTSQDHSNADSFISILLRIDTSLVFAFMNALSNESNFTISETSSNHSPYFDWVLAHMGNTFPQTVVTEVLKLGLNNFAVPGHPPNGSVLSSIAGILEHLSSTHSKEVQMAFDKMLQDIFSGYNPIVEERFIIPYLFQLCTSSTPLVDVLMDSIIPKLKEDTLMGMHRMVHLWIQIHFGKNPQALIALVTHLILKSNRGPSIIEILVKAIKTWKSLETQARMLLKNFVTEISSLLYESNLAHKDWVRNFPCISALKDKAETLLQFLTDPDLQIARYTKQIIKLICFHEGETVGAHAIVHYFRHSETDTHLWNSTDLIASLEMRYPKLLAMAIQRLVIEARLFPTDRSLTHLRPWQTILRIIKTEVKGVPALPVKIKISEVIRENLSALSSLLDTRKQQFRLDEACVVVSILAHVPDLTYRVPFGTLIKVERFLVELLFRVLAVRGEKVERGQKIQQVSYISKLLNHICTKTTQALQNDALRSLVQTCLNPDCRQLFQKTNKLVTGSLCEDTLVDDDEFEPERFTTYVSLLQENQKRSVSVSMNRTHSTSFHSGRLSKSNRNSARNVKVAILENEDHELNVLLFLSVIISVCMAVPVNGREVPNIGLENKDSKVGQWRDAGPSGIELSELDPEVNVEAMRKVALLLVEIVSPDVMFNGLPWPEEEFSKVQVERDLQIRRAFEEHPYLWDLLELVANYCPSLCYCSVLLRALMATFISHWTSCQKAKASLYPAQLQSTVRLVKIMKLGQLIPPPLCHIGLVIPELMAKEVVVLLRDIWWYMKIHVPIPTRFIIIPDSNRYERDQEFLQVPPMYTERLRLTLINNAETVGYLYPKLFPIQNLSAVGTAITPPLNTASDSSSVPMALGKLKVASSGIEGSTSQVWHNNRMRFGRGNMYF